MFVVHTLGSQLCTGLGLRYNHEPQNKRLTSRNVPRNDAFSKNKAFAGYDNCKSMIFVWQRMEILQTPMYSLFCIQNKLNKKP